MLDSGNSKNIPLDASSTESLAQDTLAMDTMPDALRALTDENASLREKLLRVMADMENARRRHEKALQDTTIYAITQFARELLTVSDTLRRALASLPTDSADPFAMGVAMTERSLQAAFEKFSIKEIKALGATFDPSFHEALMEVDTGDESPGTVVQILESGYMIGDRLLRPAKVAIRKV